MPGTTPATTPAGAAPGTNIWISVSDPQRAPLGELLNSAIAVFERAGLNVDQLRSLTGWLTGSEGNPQVGSRIGRMTEAQRTAYVQVVQQVAAEYCNPATSPQTAADPGQRPRRPGLGVILERAIARFQQEGWPTTQLESVQTWLNTRGNRTVSSYIGRLSEAERTSYLQDNAQVVARMCGYQQFAVPTITSVTLTVNGQTVQADQIRAGQTVTVTLNGNRLPNAADAAIQILDAQGAPISALAPQNIQETLTGTEVTALTFTLAIPADAATGQRGVTTHSTAACATNGVDAAECAQLSATQPNAFSIAAAANATPPNCSDNVDNDRDGRTDAQDPDCAPGGRGETAIDLPESCTDNIDNDHDGRVDAQDPDCQATRGGTIRGEQSLTGAALGSYYYFNALRASTQLQLGFALPSGDSLGTLQQGGYERRSYTEGASQTAQLSLRLGDTTRDRGVVIVGQPSAGRNPLISTNAQPFELLGDLNASAGTYLMTGDPTHQETFGIGLMPRIYFNNQAEGMHIDLLGDFDLRNRSLLSPTSLYFNGLEYMASAGLGLGYRADNWSLRAYGQYRHNWFNMARETSDQYSDFSGERRGVFVGGIGNLDLANIANSRWAPALQLRAGGMVWGETYTPFRLGSRSSYTVDGQRSFVADLSAFWNNWLTGDHSLAPFLSVGYRSFDQSPANGDRNNQWLFQSEIGVDSDTIGRIAGGYYHLNQAYLFTPGDLNGGFAQWTLPWVPNQSLSVRGDVYSIDDRVVGGASVLWDPIATFLPAPPQAVRQPAPQPALPMMPLNSGF